MKLITLITGGIVVLLLGFFAHTKSVTLMATGDAMLGRDVDVDHAFDGMHDTFTGVDAVFVNFEGSISDPNSSFIPPPPDKHITLLFKQEVAKLLHNNNIQFASLANNHGIDGGRDGIALTRMLLQKNGVSPIGDPEEISDEYVVQKTLNGIPLTFIGLNTTTPLFDAEKAANLVNKYAAKDQFVIVSVHWGLEYTQNPLDLQKRLAHSLIDNGADLILGSHPHVVQPIEKYKDGMIFYSLGNFIFDQYAKQTQQGLTVKFTITPNKVTYKLIPVHIVKTIPHPMDRKNADTFIRTVGLQSDSFSMPFSRDKSQIITP